MSNPESFIDEVTEEVRRDKLYATFKKYGWIGAVAVIGIVGTAAFTEWQAAKTRAEAQAAGDAIFAAIDAGDPAAIAAAAAGQPERAALGEIIAAAEETDPAAAAARLDAVAADTSLAVIWTDLATLKRALLSGAPEAPAERIARLEPLTLAGRPFRVLAEEQIAMSEIEAGDPQAAITRLQALLSDQEASGALRQRASQLIVALGGTPES